MKAITMKKTTVTNPARAGFVAVSTNSTEMSDYVRKANAIRPLDVNEERELALKSKNGDLLAKNQT